MTDTSTMPANVIAALARVELEIGGIAKMTKADRQRAGMAVDTSDRGVTWAYRGIDQIAAAAQPLLGKYGVVIVPNVVRHVVDDLPGYGTGNSKWTDTTVEVRWTIYGPGGVTDRIRAFTVGLGRDNSDKGYNKAMTVAYKNLLLRLLSIGDPVDDVDHTNTQPDVRPAEPDPVLIAWDRVKGYKGTPVAELLLTFAADTGRRLTAAALAEDPQWLADLVDKMDAVDMLAAVDAADDDAARHEIAERARHEIAEQLAQVERARQDAAGEPEPDDGPSDDVDQDTLNEEGPA